MAFITLRRNNFISEFGGDLFYFLYSSQMILSWFVKFYFVLIVLSMERETPTRYMKIYLENKLKIVILIKLIIDLF